MPVSDYKRGVFDYKKPLFDYTLTTLILFFINK